ncbi:MAG: PPC domain-containing protein [Acidobacteria bacterium]|nr:PPC domain-containing protein [Acidobacteriota bacterium]
MRLFVSIWIGAVLISGWNGLSALRLVVAQQSSSYLALVASVRTGSVQGTGDVTMLTVGPTEVKILGSIPTTGSTVELAVAPNGQYAIALNQERLASVITGLNTAQPMESRVFSVGGGPNAVAITPDNSTAIILNGAENPPTAMIVDGLPDAPRVRTTLPIPGAVLGGELDIAMFASGESAAISTGCGGLSLLDGIQTDAPIFRAGSPFTFTGCSQGLSVAPDDSGIFTASLLTRIGFAVLRVSGVQPGETPTLAEMTPAQSATLSNLRLSPDGTTLVSPGFQGISIFRVTDMGILPVKLVTVAGQLRAARQGGVAISPDSRVALVASLDTLKQTRLSVISDLLTDDPQETAHLGPSEMVNTREGAQQSVAFVPLPMAPAFTREEEPNDSLDQANSLTPDVTVLGAFDRNGDVDYFGFDAETQKRVVIETRAQRLSPASSADTILTLFDSKGNALAENDDAGATLDSRVEFTIPASGRYFFRVTESRNKGGLNFNYEATITLPSN